MESKTDQAGQLGSMRRNSKMLANSATLFHGEQRGFALVPLRKDGFLMEHGKSARPFVKILDELWADLLSMAALVENALNTSVRAFRDHRTDLATEVRKLETEIDQLELRIEESCLRILALYDPVAADLRRVTAVFKVNPELERMADLARHIAKRVKKLSTTPIPESIRDGLESLSQEALRQVHDAIEALANLDADKARRIRAADHFIDRMRHELVAEIKNEIRKNPADIDGSLRLINTVRNFERISDHACNIAESVVYLAEGQIIRHAKVS